MEKKELLYEGKAKKVFLTDDPDVLIVDYKDDATAFNGEKKGTIGGKGIINNRMTNHVFRILEKQRVPTHLIEELSERETAVKKVEIIPLEVIVRNVAAGSFSKRLGIPAGTAVHSRSILACIHHAWRGPLNRLRTIDRLCFLGNLQVRREHPMNLAIIENLCPLLAVAGIGSLNHTQLLCGINCDDFLYITLDIFGWFHIGG